MNARGTQFAPAWAVESLGCNVDALAASAGQPGVVDNHDRQRRHELTEIAQSLKQRVPINRRKVRSSVDLGEETSIRLRSRLGLGLGARGRQDQRRAFRRQVQFLGAAADFVAGFGVQFEGVSQHVSSLVAIKHRWPWEAPQAVTWRKTWTGLAIKRMQRLSTESSRTRYPILLAFDDLMDDAWIRFTGAACGRRHPR